MLKFDKNIIFKYKLTQTLNLHVTLKSITIHSIKTSQQKIENNISCVIPLKEERKILPNKK